MTLTSTELLLKKMKSCFIKLDPIVTECDNISKLYFSEVNPDATFSDLPASAAATFSTKLTKQEIINALTIAEQVRNFFGNLPLTQSDYRQNLQGIIYGNDVYTSPGISVAIEDYGVRAVAFANSILEVFDCATEVIDIYFDADIANAIGAVVGVNTPWYNMSKSDFTSGVNLLENFRKMINNEAANQGDYQATMSKWRGFL